jgi:cytochrome P450 family 6
MGFWLLLAILAVVVYFANQHFFSYWKKRGIAFKDPIFLLGAVGELFLLKQSFGEYFGDLYTKFKQHKVLGIFLSYRPGLVVNDPDVINDILIKDFNSFHDRGLVVDEKIDPLGAHLFILPGQRWRDLRVKLSPVFTSGKLKGMFPTIRDCSKVLQVYVENNVKNGDDTFEVRDLLARFTTNVISSVAFGIDNDCINDRENIFRKMGMKVFEVDFKQAIQGILALFTPKLFLALKIKQIPKEIDDFFMSMVRQSVEHREKSKNNERKDIMQLLIQLKNDGFVSADKDDENEDEEQHTLGEESTIKKLSFDQVAAQTFVFFIAGFETSSSTMNFCLFELCRNPEVQKKVHEELDKFCKTRDAKDFTYEMLGEMKYLECCIDEALRKYPIVPILNRECTKDITLENHNISIEKGTPLFIPALGIQRDPEIYECPMEFRPERFLNSTNGNGRSTGTFYMPFGTGNRNCIVSRFFIFKSFLVLHE